MGKKKTLSGASDQFSHYLLCVYVQKGKNSPPNSILSKHHGSNTNFSRSFHNSWFFLCHVTDQHFPNVQMWVTILFTPCLQTYVILRSFFIAARHIQVHVCPWPIFSVTQALNCPICASLWWEFSWHTISRCWIEYTVK